MKSSRGYLVMATVAWVVLKLAFDVKYSIYFNRTNGPLGAKKTIFDNKIKNIIELEKRDCHQWTVVVAGNEPSESIKQVVKLDDWCTVVVSNVKTSEEAFRTTFGGDPNVVFLSTQAQNAIMETIFPQASAQSVARKNLGYLVAIASGATAIFDLDESRVLKSDAQGQPIHPFSLNNPRQHVLLRYISSSLQQLDSRPFNPFPLMSRSKVPRSPRGFPRTEHNNSILSGTHNDTKIGMGSIPIGNVGIVQSVCDGDQNTDASGGNRKSRPLVFDNQREATKLLIPVKSYAPYNAQSTVHLQKASWGLFLPQTVPDSIADVWRSYIAQRIFHDLNLVVVYTPPIVSRDGDEKSFLPGLDDTFDFDKKTQTLLEFLAAWKCSSTYLPQRIESLFVDLYEREYIGLADARAIQQWLLALLDTGYEFPLLPKDATKRVAPIKQPVLQNQPFLAFPHYNRGQEHMTYPAYLASAEGLGAKKVWNTWLEKAPPMTKGPRRPDRVILKLVLMTKDEWPLIVHWTMYHGELLGFENLYIIDDSTNENCTTFLKFARDNLGANVIFSTANLNKLIHEMSFLGNMVRGSSDFLIKMDTDEFLTVAKENTCSEKNKDGKVLDCQLTPYQMGAYLNNFSEWESIADGRILNIPYYQGSAPDQQLCDSGRGDDISSFPLHPAATGTTLKVVSDSRTFREFDLGGHVNFAYPPFHTIPTETDTRLGIIHIHYRCMEHEVSNNRKAVLSHGFIPKNATKQEELAALQHYAGKSPCKLKASSDMPNSNIASGHKVFFYAQYLSCPKEYKDKFYPAARPRWRPNADFATFLERAMTNHNGGRRFVQF